MADEPARKFDFDRVFRLLLTVGGVVALLALLRYLADVLLPFAAAVLLAYLLNPAVVRLDRKVKRRTVSVLIVVVGAGLICLALLALMIPVVQGQVSGAAEIISQMRSQEGLLAGVKDADETWPARYQRFCQDQSPRVQVLLDRVEQVLSGPELESMALAAAKKLVPGVWGVVTGALSMLLGLMGLVVVVLYLIFLLIDYPQYSARWRELLPPRHRDPVIQFLEEFTTAMGRYFRGQALVALCVGILFVIGFMLIGLRMSLILGLFIGALNMIPYLQTVGLVPALLLAVLRAIERGGGLFTSVVLVLLVFAVVQTIQDAVLTPRIMGKATGLKPIMILLGVFIWGKLLGFLGLLLAIPLTCLGIAYYRRFVLGQAEAQMPGDA